MGGSHIPQRFRRWRALRCAANIDILIGLVLVVSSLTCNPGVHLGCLGHRSSSFNLALGHVITRLPAHVALGKALLHRATHVSLQIDMIIANQYAFCS